MVITIIGGTLPKHTVPAISCAHEFVPALRIARQRSIDPQILHVFVRVPSPTADLRPSCVLAGRSVQLH
eukprot:scaffold24026_cov39-Phaeocystis_antarctica.AAC.2